MRLVLVCARYQINAVSVKRNTFVIGGNALRGFYEIYDPEKDVWVRGDNNLLNTFHSGAAYVYGNIYIIGGFDYDHNCNCLNSVEMLNLMGSNIQYKYIYQYDQNGNLLSVSRVQ